MKSAQLRTAVLLGGTLSILCGGLFAAEPPALAGSVRTQRESQMEGVLVSARKMGARVTISVVSNAQGRYEFPGERLEPGDYRIQARAAGYDLTDPGTVKVTRGKTADVDLALTPTKDLASQMTNADWFYSNPEIKKRLMDNFKFGNNCIGCHSLSVVMKSKYKAEEWPAILMNRMWQYAEAAIYEPRDGLRIPAMRGDRQPERPGIKELAEFLASINLSARPDGTWPFELKTLPRVKGRSTRVIVTEYDLPRREAQPHDAAVAPDGMVWYTDVGNPYLGRLDPRSGAIKEWRIPNPTKPGDEPEHTFDIKFDPQGNPIVGSSLGVIRFDAKTERFTAWEDVPGGMVAISPDGIVWTKDQGKFTMHRLDPKTGAIKVFPYPEARPMRFYGIEADSKGNVYGASLQLGAIGELNGATGQWKLHTTPSPNSGSRRGDVDKQDRFWFAEYYAGKIGVFDTKTKQFKEWDIPPVPWSGPYDVVVDKNGEVWASGEFTDNLFRLNPATGEVTAYPVSSGLYMQVQRVDVDNSTNPVTVWMGENHLARIAKVEPLD
jgi:virginiamycin B lyase